MTGGAFLGSGAPRSTSYGAARLQRGVSDNIVHGTGRDAFAELDDDLVLTGPKSPGGQNSITNRPSLSKGSRRIRSSSRRCRDPRIPRGPFRDTHTLVQAQWRLGIHRRHSPTLRSRLASTDASADDVERIRQRAHDLELSDKAEPPIKNLGSLPPLPTSLARVHGVPSVDRDLEAARLTSTNGSKLPPADYAASGTLPERAQVERTDSGRVDPLDPAAHQVRGPGLLVPRDEVAEAKILGLRRSRHPLFTMHLLPRSMRFRLSRAPTHLSISQDRPPTEHSHLPAPPTPSSAVDRARQAVAMGRTKSQSQRLRRPPPGTVLSAADLDASDDEYEPDGQASPASCHPHAPSLPAFQSRCQLNLQKRHPSCATPESSAALFILQSRVLCRWNWPENRLRSIHDDGPRIPRRVHMCVYCRP
ncbi:hypothetical protein L1887_48049 [Cichorium endivia]|nr:hypothetical protein L1887_48049 [Cichorium endivia]